MCSSVFEEVGRHSSGLSTNVTVTASEKHEKRLQRVMSEKDDVVYYYQGIV